MSLDIKYIKDTEGNNYFPVVHEKGVVDDNGTTLESKLQSKQDAIGDIDTIRNKANSAIQSITIGTTTTGEAGSSANVTNTGTATEPVLSFTIPQGAQGVQGIQGPQGERGPQGDTGVQVDSVASIIHSIDPTATYAAADVAGADAVQDVLAEVTELGGVADILQTIDAIIPSAASAQNQLADKNYVNDKIATNTANFVGTFNSLTELQAVQNPSNNDYGFVIEIDGQGNEYYDRYRYVTSSQQWLFEYKVDSTPFTAEQWAAIQSGITSALVTKLTEGAVYFGDTVGNVTTADFNAQTDTVWNKTQVLSAAQQAQARTNIGAGTVNSVTVNGTTYTPINGDVNLGTISGGGGSVTVDTALDATSTNPVQNKVIAAAIGDIETLLASI